MKRYKLQDRVSFGIACEVGEWVKYQDAEIIIKELHRVSIKHRQIIEENLTEIDRLHKETHRLEQIAIENSDWYDCLKIDFDKQKEEKEEIEKQKAIMRNIINLKNKKIKKLNRLTDTLLSTMVEFGIKQAEEVQKTLEETDA